MNWILTFVIRAVTTDFVFNHCENKNSFASQCLLLKSSLARSNIWWTVKNVDYSKLWLIHEAKLNIQKKIEEDIPFVNDNIEKKIAVRSIGLYSSSLFTVMHD